MRFFEIAIFILCIAMGINGISVIAHRMIRNFNITDNDYMKMNNYNDSNKELATFELLQEITYETLKVNVVWSINGKKQKFNGMDICNDNDIFWQYSSISLTRLGLSITEQSCPIFEGVGGPMQNIIEMEIHFTFETKCEDLYSVDIEIDASGKTILRDRWNILKTGIGCEFYDEFDNDIVYNDARDYFDYK